MNQPPHNWQEAQQRQIRHLHQEAWSHRGADAYDFLGQVCTRSRIAAIIQLAFGISYHPRHVGRLCQVTHWSTQKPAPRARQRDEVAIARWREDTWPAIKRGRNPSGSASSF